MMHYAKGVAHAALGDVAAAEAEQALFHAAGKTCRDRVTDNGLCVHLLAVAEAMLAGEIAYRRATDAASHSARCGRTGGRSAV